MYCSNCGIKFKLEKEGSEICDTCVEKMEVEKNSENSQEEKKGFFSGFSLKNIFIGLAIVGFLLYKVFVAINNSTVDKINPLIENYNIGKISAQELIVGLEKEKDSSMMSENKIVLLQSLANAYYTEGNFQKSFETNKETLLLLDKNSFDFFMTQGDVLTAEEKYQEAEKLYKLAYAKKPNDYFINNALCIFYIDAFPSEKAVSFCETAYKKEKDILSKGNLGVAYITYGQNKEGIALLRNFDFKENPHLAYWMGLGYYQEDDEENAKKYFQIALDNGMDVGADVLEYLKEE